MLKKIQRFFRMSRHYAMEIFSIQFLILSALMLGVCTFGYQLHQQDLATFVQTQAVLSNSFRTSKSDVEGRVVNVYTNKQKTRGLVLLKFDNISDISLDSKQYQMFVTPNYDTPKNNRKAPVLSGSIYVFGSSGYIGLYFNNTEGFDAQVLDITVRCNAELVEKNVMATEVEGDASFAQYDQFRVVANLGAKDSVKTKALGSKSIPDVVDLYEEIIVPMETEQAYENLENAVKDLYSYRNQIDEYQMRLVDVYGLKLQSEPSTIVGDVITRESDEKGQSSYEYTPKYIFIGGYNFDWSSKTTDYGKTAIANSDNKKQTLDQLISANDRLLRNNRLDENENQSAQPWVFSDGSKLSDMDSNDARYEDIYNDIRKLSSLYTNYSSLKQEYQTKMLRELLVQESRAVSNGKRANVNTGKKVLIVY